jgi:acetyl-CoA carboxylase biotin carboxyl carrier protein
LLFKPKGVKEIVAELVDLLNKYNLSEIEYEKNGQRVKISNGRGSAPSPAALSISAQASTSVVSTAAGTDLKDAVKSPMVGVVYLRPEPGAGEFVQEGSKVKKGDILCLVEAMKTFNPVKSDKDGVVRKVLVKPSETVEYGQPLFIVE